MSHLIDLDEYVLKGEPLPDIQAIGGEKWFPLETSMEEDIPVFWGGDFGVSSECNKLRAVLLHRPGAELDICGRPRTMETPTHSTSWES